MWRTEHASSMWRTEPPSRFVVSSRFVSSGFVSSGFVSSGFVSSGFVSSGFVSSRLASTRHSYRVCFGYARQSHSNDELGKVGASTAPGSQRHRKLASKATADSAHSAAPSVPPLMAAPSVPPLMAALSAGQSPSRHVSKSACRSWSSFPSPSSCTGVAPSSSNRRCAHLPMKQ